MTAVIGTGPFNGASNVALGSNITAQFDVALDPSTVNLSTIQLKNAANQFVPATVSYNASTRTAVLNPTTDLALGNTYYYAKVVGGPGGVKDANGNALPADFTWSFTTGAPAFSEQTVFSGLVQPTAVEFAPDGSVFIAEKSGLIKRFDNLTDTTPTVVADLRTNTHNFWDRGLLGMALDPQFNSGRPYIYVLYTYDGNIGGAAPVWGTVGGTSDGGGSSPTGTGANVSGRLSRLTIGANGQWNGVEQVLIHDWVNQFPSHSIGHLAFGPDGMLYASAGDGASFNFVDSGQVGNPFNDPANEGGALRAQDVRSTGDPTSLDGSIIRIDPNTGAAAAGNPITTGDANAKRIIAYGLRNPMRFTFRPGTSEIWVGDVGWGTYEEINRVNGAADSLADNFGWPAWEGPNRQAGYDALNAPLLESLYTSGADLKPYYAYRHDEQIDPSSTTEPFGGSSITGLAFYNGGMYPAAFDGALFFTDYSRQHLYVMFKGANGLPDPATRKVFKNLPGGAVELTIGPSGDLFYVDHNNGRLRRFVATSTSNNAPVAGITADKTQGALPLTINFSAADSFDPDPGDTLSYAWDLDDDGAFDDATGVTASYTYTEAGPLTVSVRVTDRAGAMNVAQLQINPSNTAPVPVIVSPAATLNWSVGDTIEFVGLAMDTQDGPLAASRMSWTLVLVHGNELNPNNGHEHIIQTFEGVSTGSFIAPDHEYPSWLELRLTATDAFGLAATTSVTLMPQTVSLNFASNPTGATLTFNGTTQAAPFSKTVIAGSSNSVSVATSQTIGGVSHTFQSWSNGGAATHNFVASASGTYTATFASQAVTSYLINAGGTSAGSYTGDKLFTGGTTFSTSAAINTSGLSNPAPMSVYQTERTGTAFSYVLDGLAPGSSHTVRLHFAEIWWTSGGKRSFNVAINGSTVLSNFDVFAAAGGANKAIARSFTAVADSAGKITIAFTTNLDQAKVSAIELMPLQQATSVAIHAGGSAVGSFAADDFYTGGSIFTTGAAIDISGVENAGPASLYQTERTGTSFGYNIGNLEAGASYTVRLHFAEIWWTSAGKRAFSVAINGATVLNNFDVFAAAGGANRAIVKTFVATANSSGVIAINFSASLDQAKISGIEVLPAAGNLPAAPTNLNASSAPGQVLLNWNAVHGATSYRVYRATSSGGQSSLIETNVTGTSFTDTSVAEGTTYYYTVTAVGPTGEGAASNEASTTTRRSTALIDSGGAGANPFGADASFTGGGTFSVGNAIDTSGVANAAPAGVYQTERYGNVTYDVAGLEPGASVNVRLHFAEIWWTSAGQRLFNVSINGQQVLANFDIFASAGGRMKALVKEFAATVDANGAVSIQFQTVLDNASIAGIEILAGGTTTTTSSSRPPVLASLSASGGSATASITSLPLTKAEKKAAKKLAAQLKREAKKAAQEQKRAEKLALHAARKAAAAAKRAERQEMKQSAL